MLVGNTGYTGLKCGLGYRSLLLNKSEVLLKGWLVEWIIAAVLKTVGLTPRRFESYTIRQIREVEWIGRRY